MKKEKSIKIKKKSKTELDDAKRELQEKHNFYTVQIDKNGRFSSINFDKCLLLDKLKSFGISTFDLDKNTTMLVQINNGLIKEFSKKKVADYFQLYVENLPPLIHTKEITIDDYKKIVEVTITPKIIKNKMLNLLNLFKDEFLERVMGAENIKLLEEGIDNKYFFYQNGYTEITADKITFNNYNNLDRYIWSDSILKRDFKEVNDNQKSYIYQFFSKICDDKPERLKSLMSIIGYLMHSYNERKPRAVIITDSKISMNEERNGRTGKTLIGKAIERMLNTNIQFKKNVNESSVYTEISGEEFDSKNDKKYEKVELSTQLIHLNDLKRGFNFEVLYSDVTEGIKVRKLYTKPFSLHPKFLLTTNTTVKIEGDSSMDRVIQFELSQFFSIKNPPDIYFKHWFFDGWDEIEWHRFDQTMIECMQLYLKNGIIAAPVLNLNIRNVIEHTDQSFFEFMEFRFKDKDDDGNDNTHKFQIVDGNFDVIEKYKEEKVNTDTVENFEIETRNKRINKSIFFDSFIAYNPDMAKGRGLTRKKFTSWIRIYIEKLRPNLGINDKIRSDGQDYFYLYKK